MGNKYRGNTDDILKTGSPSILVNFQVTLPDLPFPHVAELQIYPDHFLSHKKCQHKTYEFARALKAKNIKALLGPVYKPLWQSPYGQAGVCQERQSKRATGRSDDKHGRP